MREIRISENEAGQRLDKLLFKYLNKASSGFVYKMLRKKNIKLNNKKADGKEILSQGDLVTLYLSDDTCDKFMEAKSIDNDASHIQVVYEDGQILLLNKPAGMLSQKAKPSDVSLNEEMLAYLLKTGEVTEESLKTFTPSICNRLDRNTAGILICGKTLEALQQCSRIIRDRSLGKFYKCICYGHIDRPMTIEGYLKKNEKTNKVQIFSQATEEADYIKTAYKPLEYLGDFTLLEVELITGKSHQIRAHLNSIGHPLVGERKYIDRERGRSPVNGYLDHQALFSYKLVFPEMPGELSYLSHKTFEISEPDDFLILHRKLEIEK